MCKPDCIYLFNADTLIDRELFFMNYLQKLQNICMVKILDFANKTWSKRLANHNFKIIYTPSMHPNFLSEEFVCFLRKSLYLLL